MQPHSIDHLEQPSPEDILLVIEVSGSSLQFDAVTKAKLYAENGVPEYWILDIQNSLLFTYSVIYEETSVLQDFFTEYNR